MQIQKLTDVENKNNNCKAYKQHLKWQKKELNGTQKNANNRILEYTKYDEKLQIWEKA